MHVLAFGLSGGVGRAVQPRLAERGWSVLAVTRQAPPPAAGGLQWRRGALPGYEPPAADFDLLLSLGPLDRFVDWLEAGNPGPTRIIALGSMSLQTKRDAADPAERAQAGALADAEARLFALARARGLRATVLRPTLVYGTGDEASLAPLVRIARRWRFCPFPAGATGLRQPVHVDDIAGAILACVDAPATEGRTYELPGAERLALVDMVQRTLAVRAPGARVLALPPRLWAWGMRLAGPRPAPVSINGFLARRDADQTADPGPAQRDFGYSPRPFRP